MKVAIIGAGLTGLSTGYYLSKQGVEVEIFEKESSAGGLAAGFKAPNWNWPLENFYHHLFPSDKTLIQLANELKIKDKIFYHQPITAIWHQEKPYPFDNPNAILSFPHLSFTDKIRMGLAILFLKLWPDWHILENITAHKWMAKYMGKSAYQTIWQPLLEGKFGPYYKQTNMTWFWARIQKRTPRLGYFKGGFQTLTDALITYLENQKVQLHFSNPVNQINPNSNGSLAVQAGKYTDTFDKVITTTSPQILAKICPDLPKVYSAQLQKLKSLGALSLVLALDRPLSREKFYWFNLSKREKFPFLALVEHTNFISPAHYGGNHLIYLGDYLPPIHKYFRMTKQELLDLFLPHLPRFNPKFNPSWIRETWLFRENYTQPILPIGYSTQIPSMRTPIPNLYLATLHHVYPWDRGVNYAIKLGKEVADEILR